MSSIVELQILYEDDDCVAVNKPAGMLVHPTWLDRHADTSVQKLLGEQIGRRVLPAHRLDRPTSGVLLFGLTSDAVRHLAEQFEQRLVSKRYIAIVRGHTNDRGRIDQPLDEKHDRFADPRTDRDKPAQEAITEYETIDRTEMPFAISRYSTSRYSLVIAQPLTGRSHQIRRHLNRITHPIVGDTQHGDHRHNQFFAARFNLTRLMLASVSLGITLPSGKRTSITAEPGAEFDRACGLLRLDMDGRFESSR